MLIEAELSLDMPWAKRASILLLIAENACAVLKDCSETNLICSEAIGLCWKWLNSADFAVLPEELAKYVDMSESENPHMSEYKFKDDRKKKNALIYIVMVLAFVSNRAYSVSGRDADMSESICEADDFLFPAIVERAKEFEIQASHV